MNFIYVMLVVVGMVVLMSLVFKIMLLQQENRLATLAGNGVLITDTDSMDDIDLKLINKYGDRFTRHQVDSSIDLVGVVLMELCENGVIPLDFTYVQNSVITMFNDTIYTEEFNRMYEDYHAIATGDINA